VPQSGCIDDEPDEPVRREECGRGQSSDKSEYRVYPGVLGGLQTQKRDEPAPRKEQSRRNDSRQSKNRSEYRPAPGFFDGMETRRR
jgi:hypothetical protein